MKAQDIMSRNPASVTPDTPVQEAARLMQSQDVGVLPVVESTASKRLVGLVTDRDIAIRVVAEGRSNAMVRDAMTSNPKSVKPDDSVKDVMKLMGAEQVRRVPVVDDRGEIVGIVAQADLVLEGDDRRAEETIEKISTPGGKHSH
ncbi:MAG TPA: CBS domain-containing protein [Gemmatimonadaceae bacterium]|jgi:CBS domain-containing protein